MSFLTDNETLFRYFHILAGITWIGLLYFFNLVNLPLLKFDLKKPYGVDMAEKATANITLKTLFWFRYGALFTLIFGLILIEVQRSKLGEFNQDLTDYFFGSAQGVMIFIGVLLGIIMAFNVWFIIWPNQQVILSNNKAIAEGAANKDELAAENGPRVKKAVLASRFNTWASIPMLFGMVFGAHGANSGTGWDAFTGPLIVLAVVMVLMVLYSKEKASS